MVIGARSSGSHANVGRLYANGIYNVVASWLTGRRIPDLPPIVPEDAPEYVREGAGPIMQNIGDSIPVSKMPVDGTFPTATTQYEKRNIAVQVPIWEPDLCIHCGQCSIVCPHSIIRAKACDVIENIVDIAHFPHVHGGDVSRLEALSDAVFALSLTLLVVARPCASPAGP